ncbi:hypothetical protein MSIMFB_04436 [Mycobacterium simulans]|uniref:Uncharacterized protein n=1 Tax=Mycobacterium simulans TaxID=627089 RepID=A0A7Z7NBJ5_9MYCO|nr:hypothetical protein MSIMFB_04436 [Mycobacterium simulans]
MAVPYGFASNLDDLVLVIISVAERVLATSIREHCQLLGDLFANCPRRAPSSTTRTAETPTPPPRRQSPAPPSDPAEPRTRTRPSHPRRRSPIPPRETASTAKRRRRPNPSSQLVDNIRQPRPRHPLLHTRLGVTNTASKSSAAIDRSLLRHPAHQAIVTRHIQHAHRHRTATFTGTPPTSLRPDNYFPIRVATT